MVKKKAEEKTEEPSTKEEKEKAEVKPEKKKLSQGEFEKEVLKLADSGLSAEKIGEELRKKGIHSKEYDGKISKIMGKKYVNPDLKNTEEKLKKLEAHFQKNKQDKKAMREKERIVSKLRKIKKHLKA
jgi:ribosomal protein S15P/S13E